MSTQAKAFKATADLDLWFKVRDGSDLTLMDIPQIISGRWSYIKENWEFIKEKIVEQTQDYFDPNFLTTQIKDFSDFVDKQRNLPSTINPLADINTVNKYYAIFDNILINSINLTNEEINSIELKSNEVRLYSKNDFLRIKKDLIEYRDTTADVVGLSDNDYNLAFHRNSIAKQNNATANDLNNMLNIQQGIANVDFILANLFAIDQFVDPFALARNNANNPEINIGQYSSGTLVRLNYGEDLQSLAYRFLGDSNKWIDIAIANGLRPPYIDEIGEKIFLLSNGQGNQINLRPIGENNTLNIDKFYVNQIITIRSDTENFPEQRSIVKITQIPVSNEIILELDGDSNLNKYKVSENANIRVYKPNTTNSSYFILIPSTEPLDSNRKEEEPWFLSKKQSDEKRAKIDIAVSEDGDLLLTTNHDIKLSYGLDNAVQALKFKILTESGSLRYHPEYGIINVAGRQNNGIDSIRADLTKSILDQVAADPRFDRVESLDIVYNVEDQGLTTAPYIRISMSVRLAGSTSVIPIAFTITK